MPKQEAAALTLLTSLPSKKNPVVLSPKLEVAPHLPELTSEQVDGLLGWQHPLKGSNPC